MLLSFMAYISLIGSGIPSVFLCHYRILGIVAQAFPIPEKLSEIQCSDFAAKEELCFLQSSYKHLVHMILVS